MGATPIHDDKNTYTNLYEANSWRLVKIKSLSLSSSLYES